MNDKVTKQLLVTQLSQEEVAKYKKTVDSQLFGPRTYLDILGDNLVYRLVAYVVMGQGLPNNIERFISGDNRHFAQDYRNVLSENSKVSPETLLTTLMCMNYVMLNILPAESVGSQKAVERWYRRGGTIRRELL